MSKSIPIDPSVPLPSIKSSEAYLCKLPGYLRLVEKIKAGEPVSEDFQLDAKDQPILEGRPMARVVGKVCERLKKILLRQYKDGRIERHNYFIRAAVDRVTIRHLADDNDKGFAHTARVKRELARNGSAPTADSHTKPKTKANKL